MNVPNIPLNLPIQLNFFFGNLAFITLFIAVFLYWFDFFDSRPASKKLKNFCMIGANVCFTFLLILRWYESGHFPLSNLYESLIGLSWGFTSVHLILVINPVQLFGKINNKKVPFLHKIQNKKEELNTNQKTKAFGETMALSNSTTCLESTNSSPDFLYSPQVNLYSFKSFALMLPNTKENLFSNSGKNTKQYNFEEKIKTSSPLSKAEDKIGAITAPTSLLTSVFATFFLPPEITRASALIPALKSNWLTMHVTVMVASYAFLLIGSLLSITYCVYRLVSDFSDKKNMESISANRILEQGIKGFNQPNNQNINDLKKKVDSEHTSFFNIKNPINYSVNKKTVESGVTFKENFVLTPSNINNFNFATWLSTTSYRILGLGFPLLTIGILSGAVWANDAWGSYWSWDPKETWALITWLVFAVYFHSRYTRSPDSFVPAMIASIGFIVIWICYLGVNLLGTGLHSYGWFSS